MALSGKLVRDLREGTPQADLGPFGTLGGSVLGRSKRLFPVFGKDLIESTAKKSIFDLIPPELKARTEARRASERARQGRGRRQSVFAGFDAQHAGKPGPGHIHGKPALV